VAGGTADAAGEVISYTIAATNNGNVTLTNPGVSDPSVSDLAAVESGGFNVGDTDQNGRLSVGETWQYTASYTVTQDDIDAGGSIDNTASIATDQGATANDDASIAIEQHPSVTLAKDASVPGGTADAAGEVISYTIAATNNGNVSLTGVTVSDPSVSDLAAVTSGGFNTGDTNHDDKLSVGETWNYTASYTVTQPDLDTNGGGDGTIDNTASVTTTQGASASDSASVPVVGPALTLDMSLTQFIDVGPTGPDTGGDLVQFFLGLTNHTSGAITSINVIDSLGDAVPSAFQTPIPGSLAPGATWTTTYNHSLTAGDVSAHHVADDVTITALDAGSQTLTVMAHWDTLF